MLGNDEMDDDYFVPSSSTTLSNLFDNKSCNKEETDVTLKYKPCKTLNSQSTEEVLPDSKPTQCMFACVVIGYKWYNNEFTNKGKLGFAILKVIEDDSHNILIYDSNKITISHTKIIPTLEVTVKLKVYISFYDDMKQYWSIYISENNANDIIELLKTFNVIIKPYLHGTTTVVHDPLPNCDDLNAINTINDIDTDNLISNKTKQVSLQRMAAVGHLVLPSLFFSSEDTSDSSDSNKNKKYRLKHKSEKVKTNLNKIKEIKSVPDVFNKTPTYQSNSSKLDSEQKSNIINSNNDKELSLFLYENRISNSELRININRAHDKLDKIISMMTEYKLKDNDNLSNVQNDILKKLLIEYESKIKRYECYFKSGGINENDLEIEPNENNIRRNHDTLVDQFNTLKETLKEKDLEISLLKDQTEILKLEKKTVATKLRNQDDLSKEIEYLKIQNEQLTNRNQNYENKKSNDTENSSCGKINIKKIMNEVFHSIALQFDDSKSYSGQIIKDTVAKVIRKTTYESINE